MDSRWTLYQGALVWNGNPRADVPTPAEAHQAVAESGAMFARWTTDYDCGYPTEWWHCIKDTPFDLQKISAKHRYIIKQGIKHFEVREIDSKAYAEELYQVQVEAFKAYPKQYRPTLDKEKIVGGLLKGGWDAPYKVFAAFHRETGQMAGFTLVREREERVDLTSQKTVPAMEKLQVNAALVYALVMHYNDRLSKDFYIVDGERNIKHETNFFQYLIKYFEFRLAYCRLNIEYNNRMRLIINLLYPFRGVAKLLRKLHPLINNVYCVLYQEQIRRSFR